MRALFPRRHELGFDNYNALVFGISATGRTTDAFVSIAAYPRRVTLFLLHGRDLSDPEGLLEGTGKQVRGVRLGDATDLDRPAVLALTAEAAAAHATAFASALTTTIRTVVEKQRPRRPAGEP